MSTTMKQIKDRTRILLDAEGKSYAWTDSEHIYPWINDGRQALRGIRPETALSSDGATVTAFTRLEDADDEITEPDRFSECLSWYAKARCLQQLKSSSTGVKKAIIDAMAEFEKLARR